MAKNSPDEGKSTKMVEKQVDPSFNNLKEYRAKRQFSETPEPMADTVDVLLNMNTICHIRDYTDLCRR